MTAMEWVSKTKAVEILIFLYDNSLESNFGNIHQYTKGSYSTLDKALAELSNKKLIKEKRIPNRDNSGNKIIGYSRIISLTPKGKKVAEKLKEIEEIMEEK